MFRDVRLALCMFLCFNLIIADEIYQYKDPSGNLVISNKKPSGNQIGVYLSPREDARHKILQEELNHEQLALASSQVLLKQATTKDESEMLTTDIALHQKNIGILTKQLGISSINH
jgi:hypothetical protein